MTLKCTVAGMLARIPGSVRTRSTRADKPTGSWGRLRHVHELRSPEHDDEPLYCPASRLTKATPRLSGMSGSDQRSKPGTTHPLLTQRCQQGAGIGYQANGGDTPWTAMPKISC